MRNVAILNDRAKEIMMNNPSIETVRLHDVPITCGIVSSRPPAFDPADPNHRLSVTVKVKAFSCNYRDQVLIFAARSKAPENGFYSVGSDFVGEVVEVGPEVTGLAVGDRVIGNNAYKGILRNRLPERARQGVVTNHASSEYQVLPSAQLVKIPASLPDVKAAAFSINGQTAYSMVRKLNLNEGAHVLVTAARSNTSLFAINALRRRRVNVYALTTSAGYEDRFLALGVKEVIRHGPETSTLLEHPQVQEVVLLNGGFDAVIDPFYDLYLHKVVSIIAPGGKYISCGMWDQYQELIGKETPRQEPALQMALSYCLANNLQLNLNCLGDTADLEEALADYEAGYFDVVTDSSYTGNQVGMFLSRSFDARDRFGKVVYQYS